MSIDAMKQALEALECVTGLTNHDDELYDAIDALRERLAQAKPDLTSEEIRAIENPQEPVAWIYRGNLHPFDPSDWAEEPVTPLYTAPQRREWVGLTQGELVNVAIDCGCADVAWIDFALAIEAKLKENNA